MGLKVGTVKLENYDPNWELMFEEEKGNLKNIFKDIAITIEHIGSTAIPGLSAKPIIDIAVGVKKLSDVKKVIDYFEKDPYSVKEDSVSDEILIRKGSTENRTHFIHVMEINSDRYKNTIIFRDYLRNNEEALKNYESLKYDLAKKYENNRANYTLAKNNFINEILIKAKDNKENR